MIVTKAAFKQLGIAKRFLNPQFCVGAKGEPTFLQMVEGYFNKAAKTAGIQDDRINFLRSP